MKGIKRAVAGAAFLLSGTLMLGSLLIATAMMVSVVTQGGWEGVSRYWYAMFSGYYGGLGFLILALTATLLILSGLALLAAELFGWGRPPAHRKRPWADEAYDTPFVQGERDDT